MIETDPVTEAKPLVNPNDPIIGWRFLGRRQWLGYIALFMLFAIACVWFGNWQFERRAQARAEIARIDSHYDAPPLPLAEALPTFGYFEEDSLKWQTVEAVGIYEGDPYLARNRPGPYGVGSDVIQALRLHDGSIFFVDRGWVQLAGTDDVVASDLPQAPSGTITVRARLQPSEPAIAGRTASGRSIPSIDVGWLSSQFGGNAHTGAYGQLVSENPEGEHGVLASRPERDEGPHLSYALQWYVFILIAGLGVAYAARQEYRSLNAESDSVHREDARRMNRKQRRGPTDADVEDALLDF